MRSVSGDITGSFGIDSVECSLPTVFGSLTVKGVSILDVKCRGRNLISENISNY